MAAAGRKAGIPLLEVEVRAGFDDVGAGALQIDRGNVHSSGPS